jgi:GT2 family glycosyltransferase
MADPNGGAASGYLRRVKVSVLIATRRRPQLLRDTLSSLAATEPQPDELVVVDGDEDGSAEAIVEGMAAGWEVPTRYLKTAPGLPHQRNRGLEVVSGDLVVFSDDDVEFDRTVLGALAAAFEDPAVVGASARVVEADSRRIGAGESPIRQLLPGGGEEGRMTRYGYPRRIVHPEQPRDVEFMPGCLMSARRDRAVEVGFDERLAGYALAEDEDFSYRLSRLGRLRYVPEAVATHKNLGFRSHDSRRFNRMLIVNRAYLFRKNFSGTRVARLQFGMLVAVLVIHRLLNRDWSGVRGLIDGSVEAWRRAT